MTSLLIVVFIDAASYAMVIPIIPFLTISYGLGASVGGLLISTHALFAAAAAAPLGRLSDRFGRRPVILATIVGTALSYVIFATNLNLYTLFFSRALAGAMAGNVGVLQAAVADATDDTQRARGLGLLSAAWALGFVVGPAIVALTSLSNAANPVLLPGLIALVALAGSFAVAWRGLSDRDDGVDPALVAADAPPVAVPGTLSVAKALTIIGVVAACQTGMVAMTGFWTHWAFAWEQREVSILLLWVSIIIVGAQVVVMPALARRLPDVKGLLVTMTLCVAGALAILSAPRTVAVLWVGAPLLFCGITMSATILAVLLANAAGPRRHGAMLGLSQSIAAGGRVVGPTLFGVAFAGIGPFAPYSMVVVLLVACFLVTLAAAIKAGSSAKSPSLES